MLVLTTEPSGTYKYPCTFPTGWTQPSVDSKPYLWNDTFYILQSSLWYMPLCSQWDFISHSLHCDICHYVLSQILYLVVFHVIYAIMFSVRFYISQSSMWYMPLCSRSDFISRSLQCDICHSVLSEITGWALTTSWHDYTHPTAWIFHESLGLGAHGYHKYRNAPETRTCGED